MSLILLVLATGWIAFTLIRTGDRPGLFGGVMLSTYGFSAYFGGIGGPVGLIGLLLALAELARRDDRPPLAAELALLALAALSLVSVFYAPVPETSLQGAEYLVAFAGSGYLYGRAFGDRPGFWLDVGLAGGISLVLCEPGLLMQHAANSRMSGSLNPTGMSLTVDTPAVTCLVLLVLDDTLRGWRRAGVAAALFLVLMPIAISFGTRGTFLGAGAAVAVAVMRRLREPRSGRFISRFAGVAVALVVALLASGAALWVIGGQSLLRPFARAFAFVSFGERYDPSAQQRIALWQDAWSGIQEAPLFGHGIYSFRYLPDDVHRYPHNLWLEVLVSTGFVGLALFLAGFVPIAIAGLRRMFAEPPDLPVTFAACLLVDLLVRLQLSDSALFARSFFLAMGIIVAQCHPGRLRTR